MNYTYKCQNIMATSTTLASAFTVISDAVTSKVLPITEEAITNLETLRPEIERLSEDQQNGLIKILFGVANTVVISGNAGSGKTTVQHLASKILTQVFDCEVVKTAAFGIAALNMGGATLASTFGLMINHVLPFLDDGSAFTYREGERDWANTMETSYSVRVPAHKIYGKFKRLRKLCYTKPIYWFNDEFSTVTSEQFVVCYQLLKRLNPSKSIKLVAFGQPIQMLSPNVNSDEFGLNKHSRAWEPAKFSYSGYYTSEDAFPLEGETPEIFEDDRKKRFNYEAERNHTDATGHLDRIVKFNATKTITFGSVLVNGHGPTVKPNKDWKVLYHNLTTNHRQKEQLEFADICKAIANQETITSSEFWSPLINRINTKTSPDFESKAVWLVRTHVRKNNINSRYLKEAIAKHRDQALTYHSYIEIGNSKGYIDSVDTKKQTIYLINLETKELKEVFYGSLDYAHRVTNFFNNLTIPVKQVLVPELPVISRLNSPLLNIANGTVGHVVETGNGTLKVFRPDTGIEQTWDYIVPNYVPSNAKNQNYFVYKTLPCHQANAMTFQACQGLTITSNGVIDVDMEMLKGSRGFNSAGAMYVNLTRFTCLENLLIKVPNDSYSNVHKLNEVIFMDKSSVAFMDFIISMTDCKENLVFTPSEAKEVIEEVKETKVVKPEPEIEAVKFEPTVYFEGIYRKDNSLVFTYEGSRSKLINLAKPSNICGLTVIEKVEEDDPHDAVIYFNEEDYTSSEQVILELNTSGVVKELLKKRYDLDYVFVIVGRIESEPVKEVATFSNEDDFIKDIEESTEPEEAEATQVDILLAKLAEVEAENKQLKEQLADSVSRSEFEELKANSVSKAQFEELKSLILSLKK